MQHESQRGGGCSPFRGGGGGVHFPRYMAPWQGAQNIDLLAHDANPTICDAGPKGDHALFKKCCGLDALCHPHPLPPLPPPPPPRCWAPVGLSLLIVRSVGRVLTLGILDFGDVAQGPHRMGQCTSHLLTHNKCLSDVQHSTSVLLPPKK